MVGLRWNSEVLEDGSTTWKFEAQEENLNSTTLDHAVFWAGLFAPAPIWLLFGVRSRAREPCCALGHPGTVLFPVPRPKAAPSCVGSAHARTRLPPRTTQVGSFLRFKFEWLLLILTALSLSTANIVGYVRCKQDARSKIAAGLQGLVARTGMNASMGRALQSAAGSAFGFGS